MSKRICYINPMVEASSGPWLEVANQVFPFVLSHDATLDIKSIKPGLSRAPDFEYPYFMLPNKIQIVETIFEAEHEGYDACIVGCFHDPAVREARQVVDIPVIGLMECTLLYACTLGHRFGVVTINHPKEIPDFEDGIRLLGLESRAISRMVRCIDMSDFDVFTDGIQKPHLVADAIMEKANECIHEGADVIVIGCGALGPISTLAKLSRVTDVDVPILDCTAVAINFVSMAVDLKKALKLPTVSRKDMYAMPRPKDIDRVRSVFGMATLK